MFWVLIAVIGYLLGSIPTGRLAARWFELGDLRKVGSGNIGATNVLRTGSKSAALVTLLGDMLKGTVAVLIARYLGGETAALLAALAAIFGHLYPVWTGFQGGKGVATFLGICIGLSGPLGLIACATWLVAAFVARFSSLAALCATLSGTFWASTLVGHAQSPRSARLKPSR